VTNLIVCYKGKLNIELEQLLSHDFALAAVALELTDI
jgi:hypothetical protein